MQSALKAYFWSHPAIIDIPCKRRKFHSQHHLRACDFERLIAQVEKCSYNVTWKGE